MFEILFLKFSWCMFNQLSEQLLISSQANILSPQTQTKILQLKNTLLFASSDSSLPRRHYLLHHISWYLLLREDCLC